MISITLKLLPELEEKLRESIALGDRAALRELLADAFAPTVENWLAQNLDKPIETDSEFDVVAEHLADELAACLGANVLPLSDDAVSRAGIYEEHP
ncbi:MAG TPA: hypothetical protein IGS52_00115 [Oscillatoriaceae cyanobacterium M33_DOE_052]|uniref:Uncharacterized protein n=1 Tax=Planktothricoides sp. SpSt-374 TaxID=2282167 RepID=A0A7C3ZU61_9CYAN|nr:hypothetical protein [Oscillatoriaceae cyanobacterium M33_DOE_052]